MNKSRLILLGVALVAGGGAFFMVATGDEPVSEQVAQIVPKERGPAMVRVLVSDVIVERGERIDPAATAWVKWPEDSLPAHVITEADEAFYDSLSGLRARTTIYEGEPIIKEKTVAQGDRGLMSALLTPGMRAVSAQISGEATSSGFVLPGDRVDVMVTSGRGGVSSTELAFANVRVIAIDNEITEEGGGKAILGTSVTFELRPDQVREFITLRESTALTLVLRSIFDAAVPEVPSSEIIVLRYGAEG